MSTIAPDYVTTDLGTIQIAPEVLEIIAGLATVEVKGVTGMSGGFGGGIAQLLGRKSLSKGVKVNACQNEVVVDVSIIVEYGSRIPELANVVQRNIRHAISTMTGIEIVDVYVHIHDVHLNPLT